MQLLPPPVVFLEVEGPPGALVGVQLHRDDNRCHSREISRCYLHLASLQYRCCRLRLNN